MCFSRAGSLFLVGVTGLDDPVALKLIMTVLLLLVLFYTVLGGMVSVVITDLLQFLVLGVGTLIVSGFVLGELGWIDGLWEVSGRSYINPLLRDDPLTAKPNDGVGPVMLCAQTLTLFTAVMLWPATVSRTLAVKSPVIARQLYLFSTVPFLARRTLPALWGIGAFVFFASHPVGQQFRDAVSAGEVSTLSAMPLYLAKIIPSGLLGIVTAAMVAAFMSTHDSYLLCWSGVVAQDIVDPLFGPLSPRSRILVTRVSILVIGAFLLFWGLWYEVSQELWDYLVITGTVYLAGAPAGDRGRLVLAEGQQCRCPGCAGRWLDRCHRVAPVHQGHQPGAVSRSGWIPGLLGDHDAGHDGRVHGGFRVRVVDIS